MPKKLEEGTAPQAREQQRNQQSGGKPGKLFRTTILVGSPWPEGIEVHVEQDCRDVRDSVMAGMAGLFGTLLLGVMAYAMLASDAILLKQAFNLVQYGLGAVAVWAIGKKALHRLGKVKNVEN
jgi:hypothetical protein